MTTLNEVTDVGLRIRTPTRVAFVVEPESGRAMSRNEPTPDEHRSPYVPNESAHPWRRMVDGDSFTEGIGELIPGTSDDHRGWADRVAEVLGAQVDDFAYANLAVRGKLIGQIVADQIELARSR